MLFRSSLGIRAAANADAYIQASSGFSPDLVRRNRGNTPTIPQALPDQLRRREDAGASEYLLRPFVEELSALDHLAEAVASIAEV